MPSQRWTKRCCYRMDALIKQELKLPSGRSVEFARQPANYTHIYMYTYIYMYIYITIIIIIILAAACFSGRELHHRVLCPFLFRSVIAADEILLL